MKRIRLKVTYGRGIRTWLAYVSPAFPGLAVHANQGYRDARDGYAITHIASGRRVLWYQHMSLPLATHSAAQIAGAMRWIGLDIETSTDPEAFERWKSETTSTDAWRELGRLMRAIGAVGPLSPDQWRAYRRESILPDSTCQRDSCQATATYRPTLGFGLCHGCASYHHGIHRSCLVPYGHQDCDCGE